MLLWHRTIVGLIFEDKSYYSTITLYYIYNAIQFAAVNTNKMNIIGSKLSKDILCVVKVETPSLEENLGKWK